MGNKKFVVTLARNKGWDTLGYFEVSDKVEIQKIINQINQQNKNVSEDSYYKNEYFKVKSVTERLNKETKWKRNKKIRSFEDWKRKNKRIKSFYLEKLDIFLYMSIGISLILTSLMFLLKHDTINQLIHSKITPYVVLHIFILSIGLGVINFSIKDTKTMLAECTSLVLFMLLLVLFIVFMIQFVDLKYDWLKWSLFYVYITLAIWAIIIVAFGFLRKLYSIFTETITDGKKRIEILIAVFGTIISLIALFK